jgi:hypothetical protein
MRRFLRRAQDDSSDFSDDCTCPATILGCFAGSHARRLAPTPTKRDHMMAVGGAGSSGLPAFESGNFIMMKMSTAIAISVLMA